MMRKKLDSFICFVFFSCFVFIKADLNLQENPVHETIKYQENNIAEINPSVQNANCRCTGGECVEVDGKEVCKCPPGFGNITSTSCSKCNCGEGAECMWNNGKVCLCKPGYGQKSTKCQECNCGPDSNCTFTDLGFWKGTKKDCICKPGYVEKNEKCESPCTNNPCKNGGTCKDAKNGYECVCPSQYSGKDCTDEANLCTSHPCKNGGNCTVSESSFTCDCVKPYKGPTCETSPCSKEPCQNGGTCKVGQRGYICSCVPPYTGPSCEKDPCTSNPCTNNGTCTVDGTGFKCKCESPFFGDKCEKDPCSSSPCGNGGICKITGTSFGCICPDNFVGKTCQHVCNCENGKCKVTSDDKVLCECLPEFGKKSDKCVACDCGKGANCTWDIGSDTKYCLCPDGSKLKDKHCENPCNRNPCLNNGICKVDGKGFKCECKSPFIGPTCKDVCNCENGKCKVTSDDKVICECLPEFGKKSDKCVACDCGKGANCTWDIGIFIDTKYCLCPDGSKLEDKHCESPCRSNPCLNNGICKVDGKGFKCECKSPFTGPTCKDDPCTEKPCNDRGTCSVEDNSFKCNCNKPYFGDKCEKDPCTDKPCKDRGTCRVLGNSFKCNCSKPYFGDKCEKDPCTDKPCKDRGTCRVLGNSFKCNCTKPYFGLRCEKDPCTDKPCKDRGTCIVLENSFKCNCSKPYFGDKCEKDPCTDKPCKDRGTCSVVGNSFKCNCNKPYFGDKCEKDPCTDKPCKDRGTCSVLGNYFKCNCSKPYFGDRCEKEIVPETSPATSKKTVATTSPSVSTSQFFTETMTLNFTEEINMTSYDPSNFTVDFNTTYEPSNFTVDFNTTYEPSNFTVDFNTTYEPSNFTVDFNTTYEPSNFTVDFNTTYEPSNFTVDSNYSTFEPSNFTVDFNYTTFEPSNFTEDFNWTTYKPSDFTSDFNYTNEPSNFTADFNKTTYEPSNFTGDFNTTTYEPSNFTSDINITTYEPSNFTVDFNNTTYEPSNFTFDFNDTTYEPSNFTYDFNLTTYDINMTSFEPSNITKDNYTSESTPTLLVTSTPITTVVTSKPSICDNNPCQNGGTCKDEKGIANCMCPPQYSGENCTDTFWCTEGEGKDLCQGGGCTFDFKTNLGRCTCSDKQYYNYETKKCEVVDTCPFTIKKCNESKNEVCKNEVCQCKEDFIREKDTCVPNFCALNPCGENEDCEEMQKDPGYVKCKCKKGYIFNGDNCMEGNVCSIPGLLKCQQICDVDTKSCDCYSGYTLQSDGKSCVRENSTELCSKNCGVGVCNKIQGDDICLCPPTHVYKNLTCVDLCTAGEIPEGLCPNSSCVLDKNRVFKCNCTGKFTYDETGFTCRKKLMCIEGGGKDVCNKKRAICLEEFDSPNGFTCQCKNGFEKDSDGTCIKKCDLPSYEESCRRKGATCEMDGFDTICRCPPLLTFDSDGRCSDLVNSSYIGELAFALERYSHVPTGIQAAPTTIAIAINLDAIRQDLRDSMHTLYGDKYQYASVSNCTADYPKLKCTIEVKFKSDPKDQVKLITDSNTCLSVNEKLCFIPPKMLIDKESLKTETFVETDPCSEMISKDYCGKYTECKRKKGLSFECQCTEGLESYKSYKPLNDPNTFIHECQDIDECKNSTACPNTTSCFNIFKSYKCHCLKGLKPPAENSDLKQSGCVDVCVPNPCKHGKCEVIGDVYGCKCTAGYTGFDCNEVITNTAGKEGMKVALIILSVLVVPLILLAVFLIYQYRVLKKQNFKSSYFDDQSSTINLQPMRSETD